MPDEHERTADAAPASEAAEPAGPAPVAKPSEPASHAPVPKATEPRVDAPTPESVESAGDATTPPPVESAGAARNPGHEPISASTLPSTPASPLITAIEIENFKGIGRPMRVELRPITLLFGNNSAGKSTVLHALCYAHEILSHRNVDAHKTELGGDRIDLGGFGRFVHARDLTRAVRLRFKLNLKNRYLPDLAGFGMPADLPSWAFENPACTDGWLELIARWQEERSEPIVSEYEVGIDGRRVGRITAGPSGKATLLANLVHPLIEYGTREETVDVPEGAIRVGEASAPEPYSRSDLRLTLDLPSALPSFEQRLSFATDGAAEDDEAGSLHYQLSTLLVGIGSLLRDALAQLRYVGPLRALRRSDDIERKQPTEQAWLEALKRFGLQVDNVYGKRPDLRRWADGSAAWDLLNDTATLNVPRLIPEASDWLSREDRLDTGYRLQVRSVVELPGDAPLVARILESETGTAESPGDLVRNAAPAMVDDLASAIADAPVHREVELVSNVTGMSVRPADVGVGISQILPVVVAALDRNRPEITAIEQPELHLHPKLQVELGDLFAQQIDQGGIFLIETHSEHVLLRFMKRMRQTSDGTLDDGAPKLRPDHIAVYFVEIDPKGDQTLIREMPLNERGELVKAWPGGFFEEDLREIF